MYMHTQKSLNLKPKVKRKTMAENKLRRVDLVNAIKVLLITLFLELILPHNESAFRFVLMIARQKWWQFSRVGREVKASPGAPNCHSCSPSSEARAPTFWNVCLWPDNKPTHKLRFWFTPVVDLTLTAGVIDEIRAEVETPSLLRKRSWQLCIRRFDGSA